MGFKRAELEGGIMVEVFTFCLVWPVASLFSSDLCVNVRFRCLERNTIFQFVLLIQGESKLGLEEMGELKLLIIFCFVTDRRSPWLKDSHLRKGGWLQV